MIKKRLEKALDYDGEQTEKQMTGFCCIFTAIKKIILRSIFSDEQFIDNESSLTRWQTLFWSNEISISRRHASADKNKAATYKKLDFLSMNYFIP
jgi:hypothetical protein